MYEILVKGQDLQRVDRLVCNASQLFDTLALRQSTKKAVHIAKKHITEKHKELVYMRMGLN